MTRRTELIRSRLVSIFTMYEAAADGLHAEAICGLYRGSWSRPQIRGETVGWILKRTPGFTSTMQRVQRANGTTELSRVYTYQSPNPPKGDSVEVVQ